MRLLSLTTSALLVFASAANAQYVGVTDTAFYSLQGVITYNRACHATHPGTRRILQRARRPTFCSSSLTSLAI